MKAMVLKEIRQIKAEGEAKAKKNKAYLDFLDRNRVTQKDMELGDFKVERDGDMFVLYKIIDKITIQ